MRCRPIEVSRDGFRFCRYSVALLLWLGVLSRSEVLVLVVAAIMAGSAAMTVARAPLVSLYVELLEAGRPRAVVVLDQNGMRFAHTVAMIALTLPLALLHLGLLPPETTWRVLVVVAVFKTMGALGYCPVSRLYTRLAGGFCCGEVTPEAELVGAEQDEPSD